MNEEIAPLSQLRGGIAESEAHFARLRDASAESVAVIGMACRFPQANTPETFFENLLRGHDAVREVPRSRWDVDAFYDPDPDAPGKVSTRWAGFLDSPEAFDADFFGIPPREAEYVDPQQRIFLEVAWEALERAGLTREALAGSPTGVFAASCFRDYDRMMVSSFDDIVAYTITGGAPSMLSNRLSYVLDLRGPSITIDTACSSSLVAMHLACQSLRSGDCSVALVGGVNLLLDPATTIAASKFRMMSPVGRCKTFDASADGFVRGEGCGVVVLKRLSEAERDGDDVLAVIRGSAVNQDGRTNGLTAPNGRAQEDVIRAALRDARVLAADVGYVETHGTGTPLGDPIEVEALGRVYAKGRSAGNTCQLGAVKTNIGHLEAAAGIAGVIKAVLALRHGRIPGNLHLSELNPEIAADRSCFDFPARSVVWEQPRRFAGVSSFGFGGTNAHIILAAAERTITSSVYDRPDRRGPALITLSARNQGALASLASTTRSLVQATDLDPEGLAKRLACTRTHMEQRLALVAGSTSELTSQLEAFERGEHAPGIVTGRVGGQSSTIVFVCPGQGSQWLGMGRELLEREPAFLEAMENCDDVIQHVAGWSVLEELRAPAQLSRIGQIDVVQPLLFAMSVSLAALWRARGIEPDVVVGHSMGEVAASYIAGALELDDAARVICTRSSLMRRLSGQGEMLATELTLEQARAELRGFEDRVAVAASNGPRTTVLSGDPKVLATILESLTERAIFARRIEVEVASHSPSMDALRDDLVEALRDLRPQSSLVPMTSTVTGQVLDGAELDARYWFDNLRKPVLFHPVIEGLCDEGSVVLIECSPHPVLLPAVQARVSQEGLCVPSLRRNEPEQRTMLESLAALHTHGVRVDFGALYSGVAMADVALPTYPWQHERFWFQSSARPGARTDAGRTATGDARHPLLSSWVEPANDSRSRFMQTRVEGDPRGLSTLAARPGAMSLELALAGLADLQPRQPLCLGDLSIEREAELGEQTALELQLQLAEVERQRPHLLRVTARADGKRAWRLLVSARFTPGRTQPADAQVDLAAAKAALTETSEGRYRGADSALARIACEARNAWFLPSALLAPAFGLISDVTGMQSVEWQLVRAAALNVWPGEKGLPAGSYYAQVAIDRSAEAKDVPDSVTADVRVLDEHGHPRIELLGAVLYPQRITVAPSIAPGAKDSRHPLRQALLAIADESARRERLDAAIRGHVARVTRLAENKIERERAFDLDSLMAMQLKLALQGDIGIELPLAKLLRGATVKSIATLLLEQLAEQGALAQDWLSALPVITPAPELRHEPFELTDLQQAYWLGRTATFELGGVATYFFIEIDSDELDLPRLTGAWNQLIARHPMLRAQLTPDGRQRVHREVPRYEIVESDLRALAPSEREAVLARVRETQSTRVLTGDRWPLFEITASRLDDKTTRVHIGLDILIVDGWAISTLFREWRTLYEDTNAQLPAVDVDFRDYVVAGEALRQTPLYQRSLDFWKERAKTLPEAPKLPVRSEPRPSDPSAFVHRTALLEKTKWAAFKESARRAGVTPSTAIGAAYCEVLGAWSADRHFTLNLLFFNRLPLHPQIDDVVGNFSTTMLLEVDVREPAVFADNARKIQDGLTQSLDHSIVNGVEALREVNRRRGWSGSASMPVVFASALDIEGAGSAAKRLDVAVNLRRLGKSVRVVGSQLRTPQVYLDHQIYEEAGELRLNWDSIDAVLHPDVVDSMWAAYMALLDRLATEPAAWGQIARLGLTPEHELTERARLNAKTMPLPDELLHAGFFEMARRRPNASAVIHSAGTLSYGELARRATVLAHRLLALGVGRGDLIAVLLSKGWEQVVAVLAIELAGAAYLPIDPALPDQRIRWLVENAKTRAVVGAPAELPRAAGALTLEVSEQALRSDGELPALPLVQEPDDLAYVIYTSGSTGDPKGVAVTHRAAMNTIVDINRMFEIGPSDRAFAISSLSFDLSVYDLFGLLSVGGAVVIPDRDQMKSPAHWLELADAHHVTVWSSVPALADMLVDHCEAHKTSLPRSLKLVMMSGDWIPTALSGRIRAFGHDIKVISLGGATEAAIWSIWYPIAAALPGWSSVPYGYPMVNQRFHVLDTHLEPCPQWVSGELYIGGAGLALGYWQDPVRTAERFIEHPRTGERLYKTGDVGRYRAGSIIEFQGRNDFQVKVNGYRIELGEIEAVLQSHPAVRTCVLAAKGERDSRVLVGYWIASDDVGAEAADLRGYLAERLPAYMVPATLLQLDALPLSSNGKVDRSALPDPAQSGARERSASIAPRTALEHELHALWSSMLGTDAFGVTESFFELGGQSLLAMRVMNRVNGRFARSYPVSLMFTANTIEQLAAHIESEAQIAWSPLVALRASGTLEPFFCVHPVGGNVLCYRGLAERLDASRPFYGLQARGLVPGLEPHQSIEDAARAYIEAVRQAQPSGPYYLGGWSLGGVVAYEMARQLAAQGETVARVLMLDSRFPARDVPRATLELLKAFAFDLARLNGVELTWDDDELERCAEAERFGRVIDALKAAGALPADIELDELQALWATYEASLRALDRYVPNAYGGRVTMLCAREQPEGTSTAPTLGWERVAIGELDAELIAGDHYSLLDPLHGSELASSIDRALARTHTQRSR